MLTGKLTVATIMIKIIQVYMFNVPVRLFIPTWSSTRGLSDPSEHNEPGMDPDRVKECMVGRLVEGLNSQIDYVKDGMYVGVCVMKYYLFY